VFVGATPPPIKKKGRKEGTARSSPSGNGRSGKDSNCRRDSDDGVRARRWPQPNSARSVEAGSTHEVRKAQEGQAREDPLRTGAGESSIVAPVRDGSGGCRSGFRRDGQRVCRRRERRWRHSKRPRQLQRCRSAGPGLCAWKDALTATARRLSQREGREEGGRGSAEGRGNACSADRGREDGAAVAAALLWTGRRQQPRRRKRRSRARRRSEFRRSPQHRRRRSPTRRRFLPRACAITASRL
jgi:hypothetical protein